MKTPYDSWSIEALRGYVVMMGEFLSGSMHEDPTREAYVNRLSQARSALKIREDEESSKKTSVAFPAETVTRDEEDVPS